MSQSKPNKWSLNLNILNHLQNAMKWLLIDSDMFSVCHFISAAPRGCHV